MSAKITDIKFVSIKCAFKADKKGKVSVTETQHIFRIKTDKWHEVREFVNTDSDILSAYMGTFSLDRARIALARLYTICGIMCPDSVKKAADEAQKREDEKSLKREKRERDIIKKGKTAFEKKGSETYGKKFDALKKKYEEIDAADKAEKTE